VKIPSWIASEVIDDLIGYPGAVRPRQSSRARDRVVEMGL